MSLRRIVKACLICVHAVLFSLIVTTSPSGSLDGKAPPLPDPADLAVLEELVEWVDDGPDTDRVLLGEAIRNRADSFDLFRSYHAESDRRDQVLALPFGQLISTVAERYGIDGLLLAAIIEAESGFDPFAISLQGAIGLMQVMPETAGLSPETLTNPARNIDAGAAYLSHLLSLYRGDLELALAAYNAGPGAVKRFGGLPPYRETKRYVEKVLASYVGHHRDLWQNSESGEMLALL